MTELQKCNLAKQKGFTYCPFSGNIMGVRSEVIKGRSGYGYIQCNLYIEGKRHCLLGHRLAWFLHYGELPSNQLDHIDGVRTNNKIENLRNVTSQQNNWNRVRARGCYWNKKRNKFQSLIRLNGKLIYLGYFTTELEARNAYLEGKKKYHVTIK